MRPRHWTGYYYYYFDYFDLRFHIIHTVVVIQQYTPWQMPSLALVMCEFETDKSVCRTSLGGTAVDAYGRMMPGKRREPPSFLSVMLVWERVNVLRFAPFFGMILVVYAGGGVGEGGGGILINVVLLYLPVVYMSPLSCA